MKKLLPSLALLTLCASVWLVPSSASAVPKMDVKIFLGVGSTTFVPRLPAITLPNPSDPTGDPIVVGSRNAATFTNWGGGLSARVRAGKVFGEIGLVFSRFQFRIGESLVAIAAAQGDPIDPDLIGNKATMNSLELPLTAGYVPYANPYFKLFLYGGLINQFNIKGFVDRTSGGEVKFRPKDIPGYPLAIYVAGARLGTQFDIGPFNFDFSYTINMNSATKTDFRTNTHIFKFYLGWLF